MDYESNYQSVISLTKRKWIIPDLKFQIPDTDVLISCHPHWQLYFSDGEKIPWGSSRPRKSPRKPPQAQTLIDRSMVAEGSGRLINV